MLFSLISSLPGLLPLEPPKITSEQFLSDCAAFLGGREMALLEKLSIQPGTRSSARHPLIPKGVSEISGHKLESEGGAFALAAKSFSSEDALVFPARSLARRYTVWEMALRNSIAKLRAARAGGTADARPGVRLDGGYEADADRVVQQAYAAADPLERERILDRARWDKLDELTGFALHQFSFDAVCAYRLKLQIAEKWGARKRGAAAANLDRAASEVQTSSQNVNEVKITYNTGA